ncbi:MAG: hypothetical protein ACTHLC_19220 [Rhizobiaceae bacterium]|jgi:DNA-binding GntR family transcriptional regulator
MDDNLIEFIEYSLDSVWSLELLLTLRQQPQRTWSADELVADLRSSRVVVRKSIDRLLASGLVVTDADDSVRYAPASPDQDKLVGKLAEAYRVRPAAIRRIILRHSSDQLRTFAEAFKIMKG